MRPEIHRIGSGAMRAEIVPSLGGALAAFYRLDAGGIRRDWLRPADDAALEARDPLRMASFPLLPWCNRIRGGRFVWRGDEIELAPATAHPHALHGVGWVLPWTIDKDEEDHITLVLERPSTPEWPFAFRARQVYAVQDSGLAITVELVNSGASPMPAGIGHHPYFVHRPEGVGTRLKARTDAMWHSDPELLPTRLDSEAPAVRSLASGMNVAEHVLDNNFTGFRHEALVTWPDGSSLTMRAEAPLDFFVVYSPADADHFCAEAVSNCTDWPNLRNADHDAPVGGVALAPGETLRATTWFLPNSV